MDSCNKTVKRNERWAVQVQGKLYAARANHPMSFRSTERSMKHAIPLCACVCILSLVCPCCGQRLPAIATPDSCNLTFAPDFSKDNFTGDETIHVRVLKPTEEIVLNALNLDFQDVSVNAGDTSQQAAVTFDKEKEQVTLTVAKMLQPGLATIQIKYTGTLNSELRGFYLGRQDDGHKYAATMFEATDARRAFPSFDQPAHKATFGVTIIADRGLTVISDTT